MKNLIMNLIIIIVLVFTLNKTALAQATFEWSKNFNAGGNNNQIAYDAVTDTNGNVYMTGVHSRGYSENDMVTVKYNSSGQYQWGKTYNLSSEYTQEVGKSIALYRNGTKTYVYAAGEVASYGYTQFIKIIKYDENGNEKWQRNYDPGIPGVNDLLSKVITDASGNCYVTGSATTNSYIAKYDSSGTVVFNTVVPNLTGYTYTTSYDMALDAAGNIYATGSSDSGSTKNYFTFKYNPTGVLQWSKVFRGLLNYQSSGKSIKVGASGNIYVTGEYKSATTDYLTIKYNPVTGDTIWTKKFDGTFNGNDYGRLLSLDASENVFVTGVTYYSGNDDMATVKYNSSGVLQWTKRYSGPGGYPDNPKDMIIDLSGNIFLTFASDFSYFGKYGIIKYNQAGDSLWTRTYDFAVGNYETPYAMALDNSGNVIVTGSSGYENDADFGIIKYNSSGVLQWARKFYGAQITEDRANGVVTDKNGNAYVIGKAKTGQGGDNIIITKYNPQGVQKWVYNRGGSFSGYNAYDEGRAMTIDSSGNLYFTGTLYSYPVTKNDIFVGKLDSNGTNIWFTLRNGAGAEYGDDAGNDIVLDNSGNIYVAGELSVAGGDLNYVLIKYNSSGVRQWERSYGGTSISDDVIKDLEINNSGDLFVTGVSKNTGTNCDITTLKYSSIGVQQWIMTYNGNANLNDSGNALKADKLGNVYVCGSEVDLSSGSNSILIKYNSAGTQLWTKRYSGLDSSTNIDGERASTLGISSTDSIINVAGTSPTNNGYYHPGCPYYLLYKSDGTFITGISYPSNGAFVNSSAMDHLDNFYFSGSRKLPFSGENYDNFIYKMPSASGYWHELYNGLCNKDDFSGNRNSISVDINGTVYLAGTTYDTLIGNSINLIKYKQSLYTLSLVSFIEGLNIGISYGDTIKVFLRNGSSPYNIEDSSKLKLDFEGKGTFKFTNASPSTSYYLVLKHRNSIETWSSGGQNFPSGYLYYDFTSDSSKTYGNNVKGINHFTGRKFAMYSGDVNQDGIIDATDVSAIENDAATGLSGYVNTDITGDDFVDASDLSLVETNAYNSVSLMRP